MRKALDLLRSKANHVKNASKLEIEKAEVGKICYLVFGFWVFGPFCPFCFWAQNLVSETKFSTKNLLFDAFNQL